MLELSKVNKGMEVSTSSNNKNALRIKDMNGNNLLWDKSHLKVYVLLAQKRNSSVIVENLGSITRYR